MQDCKSKVLQIHTHQTRNLIPPDLKIEDVSIEIVKSLWECAGRRSQQQHQRPAIDDASHLHHINAWPVAYLPSKKANGECVLYELCPGEQGLQAAA